MQRKQNGKVVEEIKPEQMNLDYWNDTRYRALDRRVHLNWAYYHELFAQEPLESGPGRARLRLSMDTTKGELCTDFREMVAIVEGTLGTSLPDHYKLHEVCGN